MQRSDLNMGSFKENFEKKIIPQLKEELGLKNNLAVPRLEKIVLNAGVGRISRDKNLMEKTAQGLALIAGQKPIVTKAKRAISAFKIRQGMPIGYKVTLRRKRMYDFVEKIIKVVLPRIRDFAGIDPNSIDQQGNLTLGFSESSVFPEISKKMPDFIFGLEVTLVSTTRDRKKALSLFKALGLPFKRQLSAKRK